MNSIQKSLEDVILRHTGEDVSGDEELELINPNQTELTLAVVKLLTILVEQMGKDDKAEKDISVVPSPS